MGQNGGSAARSSRCIALVGPYLSGKTTLLEAILARTGAVTRQGKIADKNTVGDSSAEARDHGMSVEVNVADVTFLDDNFTFIDCPGSIEFQHEGALALTACDAAVVVCEPDPKRVPALQLIADLPRSHFVLSNNNLISTGLTLVNNSTSDLTLRFGSSQTFEISLLTLSGELVNSWGANKRFMQAEHDLVIKAGGRHYFGGELALESLSGEALDVGTYLLRVELKGSHAPQATAFAPETLKVEAPLFIDRRMQAF